MALASRTPTGPGMSRRLVAESRDRAIQGSGLRNPTVSRGGSEGFGGQILGPRGLCFVSSAEAGNGLPRGRIHNGNGY